jgi:hypothetical protein
MDLSCVGPVAEEVASAPGVFFNGIYLVIGESLVNLSRQRENIFGILYRLDHETHFLAFLEFQTNRRNNAEAPMFIDRFDSFGCHA